MEQQLPLRTYKIVAEGENRFSTVTNAPDMKSFEVEWEDESNGQRKSEVIKVDGGEVKIFSTTFSTDRLVLFAIVEYDPRCDNRPDDIQIQLSDLVKPLHEITLTQAEMQAAIEKARKKFDEMSGGRPMMCFTQVISDAEDEARNKKRFGQ
jgi:hypothetical protein